MKKNRVTIYDVSKETGLSSATISRIINNKKVVKKETKDKVMKAISKLGYKPSALAQALSNNKTTSLGLVIPSANYVYISNLLHGIFEEARIKGFTIQTYVTSRSKLEAKKIVDKVISSHVDGAIIFDDELDEEDLFYISSYNVPVIVINNTLTKNMIRSIHFGYEHLFNKIINKVISRKKYKKDLYFLHLDNPGRLLSRLENAYIKICNENNIKPRIINISDSNKTDYDYFHAYFKLHKKGYFISPRDSISMAIINGAISNKLKVPNEIEVLSLVGTKYSHIFKPSISNMYIDLVDVGVTSVDLVDKLIKNKLNNKVNTFESIYVKMNSTID